MAETVKKGARITGADRAKLAAKMTEGPTENATETPRLTTPAEAVEKADRDQPDESE